MSIEKIERVENGLLHESMEGKYDVVKRVLETAGSSYVNGVHARWLFHGAEDPEIASTVSECPRDCGIRLSGSSHGSNSVVYGGKVSTVG